MRTALLGLLFMVPLTLQAAPAATTTAATRPREMEPLADGSIRYLPPAGWTRADKNDNRLYAAYQARNGLDSMEISVTLETREVSDSQAGQMAMIIGKAIRDAAKAQGRDFSIPPRVEKDERFLLKMHDCMRGIDQEGHEFTSDRMQTYRVLGLNLIHVVSIAITASPEEGAKVHAQAADMLYGMRLTRGAHATVFGRAQIKVTPPVDWKVTKSDEPNGLVGTFTDPKDPLRQIIVRVRVLPKDVRSDDAKREQFLARMVDAERRLPPLKPDSANTEQPSTAPAPTGATYLRHLRTTTTRGGQALNVDTRYFVVADVLVSVRSVAGENDVEIDRLTDELSSSVKPARE